MKNKRESNKAKSQKQTNRQSNRQSDKTNGNETSQRNESGDGCGC
ncbi:MAG: hypothetical protein ACLSAO_06930 [Anaerovoracaceae bacterium]